MKTVQFDETSLLFRELKPLLNKISNGGKWRDLLLSWDGNEHKDSVEATLFEAWYSELIKLPAKEVGQDYWDVPLYIVPALLNGSDPNCALFEGGCLGKNRKFIILLKIRICRTSVDRCIETSWRRCSSMGIGT
jgi:acyl-homoserine lactone acylase PvdQ